MKKFSGFKAGLLAAVAAAFVVPSLPAIASSGGGSGGGVPSTSASRYDAVQEYQNGMTAYQAGDYNAAKRAFSRVLTTNRSHAQTHYMLGLTYIGLEQLNRARRSLRSAVRYDEDLLGARRALALTYLQLGDEENAAEQLAELQARLAACADTCADASELTQSVAEVEAAMGAGAQSSLDFDDGLRLASGGDATYLDAVGLINEERYEFALTSLRHAETLIGPHPDIYTYLGFANRKLGRFDEAEAYYVQALSIDPEHRGALEYYGELHVERGDLGTARVYLAQLEEVCAFGCAQADELRQWIDAAERS